MNWGDRAEPLRAGGALARGVARNALVRRLLALSDEALAGLSGVAGGDLVVVLGDVPWADGVTWLGADPAAPGVWLPTNRVPMLPLGLVTQVVARSATLPAVYVEGLIVPVGEARPLARDVLARLA